MKDKEEKNIIKLSMSAFFLALMIIYILLYSIKGNELKKENKQLENSRTGNSIENIVLTPIQKNEIKQEDPQTNIDETEVVEPKEDVQNNLSGIFEGFTNKEEILDTIEKTENIEILSGTVVYYGPIESIEKLGIKYQYSLKDFKNIYYIYLGKDNIDLTNIVRLLRGSLYVINTEQELIKHQLFGEKITFINIPEYKDIFVIMIINTKDKKRLLQIPYSIYHQSKSYIRNMFTSS